MEFDSNIEELDIEKAYNDSFREIEEDTIINATVVQISSDTIFLDFGYKSEAKIPISEFDTLPKIGDEVVVYLVKLEGSSGDPIVSKQKADSILEKKEIYNVLRDKKFVEGTIVETNKNGFIVKHKTLSGFIPFALFDFARVENANSFIGKKINFYIEKIYQNEGNQNRNSKFKNNEDFMGNRKKYLYQERNIQRKEFLDDRSEGEVVEGVVKNITSFGAFVDLGGIEALLHIKDISWARIDSVSDVLKVGDKVKVKILSIKRDEGKVSVGMKQTEEDPWTTFIGKYHEGDILTGSVVSMTTYGDFINIIDG